MNKEKIIEKLEKKIPNMRGGQRQERKNYINLLIQTLPKIPKNYASVMHIKYGHDRRATYNAVYHGVHKPSIVDDLAKEFGALTS